MKRSENGEKTSVASGTINATSIQNKETEITKLSITEKELLIKELASKPKTGNELVDLFNKLSLEQLQEQTKTQPEQNWTTKPDYNELHFNQWKINEPLAPQEAPTKLYDTNKDKVIPAHDNQEPYAILSYYNVRIKCQYFLIQF